jgi:hypothetical protein
MNTETNLKNTLGLTDEMSTYFLRAPQEYFAALGYRQSPYNDNIGEYDFIHAFFSSTEEMSNFADILASKLASNGIMWISWPNVSESSDNSTDISAADIREIFASQGFYALHVVEVTKNWLGLMFTSARH